MEFGHIFIEGSLNQTPGKVRDSWCSEVKPEDPENKRPPSRRPGAEKGDFRDR